jgi:hypothetical protein
MNFPGVIFLVNRFQSFQDFRRIAASSQASSHGNFLGIVSSFFHDFLAHARHISGSLRGGL